MVLEINCNSYLNNIFYYVKNILFLIMIFVPILLLIFGTISFVKLVKNPEEKNGIKKIINQFLAAGIVFFIPLLVNVVMGILGEKTSLSSCWVNAKKGEEVKYHSTDNQYDKQSILLNPKDYEPGVAELDFSCTSSVVKAQFSCETLEIVEKHLNDFDATNFKQVINSYGGFDQYAKSLGGIFGEYYGKKMPNETEADFQRAAEYVLGWMYMYGWDYASEDGTNKGAHVGWRGSDAFYAKGGFVGKYINDTGVPQYRGPGINFDDVISTKSQGGSVGRMASACGDLEFFVFNKLNINRKKPLARVSRLRDLKVGDCLFFGNGPKWNKFDESNWSASYGAHNVIVGEVYDDHAVIYDTGGYYPTHNNYKRPIYFPKEDTEEADDAEVKKVFGYTSWGIRRWYNFEP